jgi:hypothetical protein
VFWTPVKLGQRHGQRVEVLKKQTRPAESDGRRVWESFTGSEEIVQHGGGLLAEGQSVRVTPRGGAESVANAD